MSLEKCAEHIRRHKRFLITAHTNLEGDALGSEMAFYRLITKLGKRATIVNDDNLPRSYSFLPQKNILNKLGPKSRDIEFDCFVVLDSSDLKRTGEVYRLNSQNKPVLNIDHHISNQRFGTVNWVEPYASSCSEMVYKLYKKMNVPFDECSALFLYVGILTDTGSFRYSNATSFAHNACAELLKYKIDVPLVYKQVYENIPFEDMVLLCKILPGMKRESRGRIVWFQIKRGMLLNRKLSFDLSEHILSFARAIQGVEAVALFKENLGDKDTIRVNLRSQGKVDVNRVASFFGGGGHKTAAGITIKGSIDDARKKVLDKIKENLK